MFSRARACTYLPSSVVKVDDSPIRNLVRISGISGTVRALPLLPLSPCPIRSFSDSPPLVAVTNYYPLLLWRRYHYSHSARYFDSHARVSPSPSTLSRFAGTQSVIRFRACTHSTYRRNDRYTALDSMTRAGTDDVCLRRR